MKSPPPGAVEPIARRVLEAWGLAVEPRFLRKSENYVYELEDGERAYILRLVHESHRTVELVLAELDWIAFLAGRDLPVVRPERTPGGDLIHVESSQDGTFVASLFQRAPGRPLNFIKHPEDWNHEVHAQWGRLLGQLHVATREYEPSPGVERRYRWDEEARYQMARELLPANDPMLREFEACWSWLEGLPEDEGAFGLIHSDAHRGNFLVDDGRFTLFDFDDCLYGWFAMDLAMPLFYSKRHPHRSDWGRPQLEELFASLLVGYREVHDLAPIWIERVWGFLRWRRVQLHVCAFWWAAHGDPAVLDADWFRGNQQELGLGSLPFV